MSVPHILGALQLDVPDHVELVVLVRLADFANKATSIARATTRYLAHRCGNMDRGALDRALQRLEDAGHIRALERQGRNTPSRWELLFTPLWRLTEATESAPADVPVAALSAPVAALSASVAAQSSQDPVLDPVFNHSESARGGLEQPRCAQNGHGNSVAALSSHSGPRTLQRAERTYSSRSEMPRARATSRPRPAAQRPPEEPRQLPFAIMTNEQIANYVRSIPTRYPPSDQAVALTVDRIRTKHPRAPV